MAAAKRARRGRTPRLLGSVLHSRAERTVRSRRRRRRDLRACRPRSCATPVRRGSDSRKFRSRTSRPPPPQSSTRSTHRRRCSVSTPRSGVEPSTRVTLSLSKGDTASFDAVVLAVPPRQVERILGDPVALRHRRISTRTIAYPIVDVHLWHDGGSTRLRLCSGARIAAAVDLRKDAGLSLLQHQRGRTSTCAADRRARNARVARSASVSARRFKDAKLVRSAVTRNPEATWLPGVGAARTVATHRASRDRDRRILDRHQLGRHDGIRRPQRHDCSGSSCWRKSSSETGFGALRSKCPKWGSAPSRRAS